MCVCDAAVLCPRRRRSLDARLASAAAAADVAHAMDQPLSEGVSQWTRLKRPGQVVRHYKTSRHGIVVQTDGPDLPAGKIKVRFPDTLCVETRWHTAFVETDVICNPDETAAIYQNHQGIWWPDKDGVPVFLMAEGIYGDVPSQQPLRRSRRSRSTTPGARSAGSSSTGRRGRGEPAVADAHQLRAS